MLGSHRRARSGAAIVCVLAQAVLAVAALAASAAPNSGPSDPDNAPLAPLAIQRLAAVARLWGTAKLYHPYLATRPIDWDQALLDTIPRVEAATSTAEYRAAVGHLLSFLGDPPSRVIDPSEAENEEPPGAEAAAPVVPQVEWLPGRVAWIDARDFHGLVAAGRWDGGLFADAFAAAQGAAGLVLDLRAAHGAGWYVAGTYLRTNLETDLPALLTHDVVLPALRHRFHSGYASQVAGYSGYYSGFVTADHRVLPGRAAATAAPLPLVVLANQEAAPFWDVLAGLEAAGVASLVSEGKEGDWSSDLALTGVDLGEGVKVALRTAELVNGDGSATLAPSAILPASGAGGEDLARARALELLAHPLARQAPPLAPARVQRDARYEDQPYPPRALRLLALFRFWNVIEHFYPDKGLMDRTWADALVETMPGFAEAADDVAYTLAAAGLVARLQDTHGFFLSPVFNRFSGGFLGPGLQVRFIAGELAVIGIYDPALVAGGEVAVGDVIVAVDGETIADRSARLAPYLAYSTPQARDFVLVRRLLSGEKGSVAKLEVRRADGSLHTLEAVRQPPGPAAQELLDAHRLSKVTVLPSGLGYIDLTRLEVSEVASAMEQVRQTPGLVLDLRGYPRGTAWSLTPYLQAAPRPGPRFDRSLGLLAEGDVEANLHFVQQVPGGGPWQYAGKLAVLIDERAISQSEHSCLFFETARPDVVFVGTPTNGANGDVTQAVMPGGIVVSFSGHQVRHADGRQLQRVGIQPDLLVAPTLAGLRRGEDEVLAAAVRLLAGEASPPAVP